MTEQQLEPLAGLNLLNMEIVIAVGLAIEYVCFSAAGAPPNPEAEGHPSPSRR